MNNIIVPFSGSKNIDFYIKNNIDGFIIGIEGFSENFNYYIEETKLKENLEILGKNNIKSYIMLNKVIFNKQLDPLKKLLNEISKLNVEAVIFSDIAIFNIVKENNLDIRLIWSSKLITSSRSINFLAKRGLYGYISTPQITIDEFIDIRNKTNIKSIIKLFGYTNMATSSRTLISNYLKFSKINKDSKKKYYMYEKSSKEYYPIVENDTTNFFSSKILNGIMEYKKLLNNNIDCSIFLDDYLIDEAEFYNVVEAFTKLKNNPEDDTFAENLKSVIDTNMHNNTDNGFLNKKTIVKVKNNE